jgi:enoyl-CoA hydratase/carnithine racemase
MSGALVTREDKDGLALLTLNRPDKLNSLTVGMFRELRGHVSDLYKDESIGCVVLRRDGELSHAVRAFLSVAEHHATTAKGAYSFVNE